LRILDSTLREGELFKVLPVDAKIKVATKLAEAGVGLVELTVDYPPRTTYEDNSRVVRALSDMGVAVVLHGRANEDDLESMSRYDLYGCALYIAISGLHREFKLHGITKEEAVGRLAEGVEKAQDLGFRYIRATLEDASRLFLEEGEAGLATIRISAERLREAGATILSVPDTSGLMTTTEARAFFKRLGVLTQIPLSAHFHNDYGFASANTVEAVLAGAEEAQVTVMGVGDRNGIADMYEVVATLEDIHGIPAGINRGALKQLYSFFSKTAGIELPWRHPLSQQAQTVRAGVHQSMTVRKNDGYIPSKKLTYDFGEPLYAVSPFVSHNLIQEILAPYSGIGPERSRVVAEALAQSFPEGSPSIREVRQLILREAGVDVPEEALGRYFACEKVYVLLKLRPQYPVRNLLDDISNSDDVETVDEVYGEADVVIRARSVPGKEGVLSLLRQKYAKEIQEMKVLVTD
jgi:isopropylmalate/homocitrate/citramalate synthase